jgi:hypothetical protein
MPAINPLSPGDVASRSRMEWEYLLLTARTA